MKQSKNMILEAGLRGEEVFLKGIILAGPPDDYLKTTSLVLSTDQELDFMIEDNAKGTELFDHLRNLVKVKGFIRESGKTRTIRITEYEILEKPGV